MQNKNIIIGILSGIILIGGIYIYQLSNRTVVLEDVKILELPFNLSTKTATTAPPYIAPEPDESVATTTQTGKIDEHLTINPTLREVNFCGNNYKVKQVMIDGVDVVQRIAEILTKDLIPDVVKIGPYATKGAEWKPYSTVEENTGQIPCLNIKSNMVTGNIIEIGEIIRFPATSTFGDGDIYVISIQGEIFNLILVTGEIYMISSAYGEAIGPIGKLK